LEGLLSVVEHLGEIVGQRGGERGRVWILVCEDQRHLRRGQPSGEQGIYRFVAK
jgi:hypothetical protein